jgi:hypothetical protein
MSFNITGNDLDLMEDRQYSDAIVKTGMRDGAIWSLMLEEERIDRTAELLKSVKVSLLNQLVHANQFQQGGEADWNRRTKGLLSVVDVFYTEVKNEVKRLDAEEREESAVAHMGEWKRLCFNLVEKLPDSALDGLYLPDTAMTLIEWRDMRVARKLKVAA